MPAPVPDYAQIATYEAVVAEAWGGAEKLDQLFAASPHYKAAFIDAVSGRFQGTLQTIIPWVERLVPEIRRYRLFEVGCGTGSSTAAFATVSEGVVAFDVAENVVSLAQKRLECFGLANASAQALAFPEILQGLHDEPRIDGVLLYAVLEHMHVSERINILRAAWQKLPPGGVIIVCETPNRLSYFDRHTFLQPFANMLPPELAKMWAINCVNDATRNEILALPDDYVQLKEGLTRMGQSGPSYHEFELAIGEDVHRAVISGEFDPEIQSINGEYRLEHDSLAACLRARAPHVHRCFAMTMFYIILQKPGG